MAKKSNFHVWNKTRSALRMIYRGSPMRREALKAQLAGRKEFICPLCQKEWPWEMVDVDHEPPCGSLLSIDDLVPFFNRLMYGTVQLVCKRCHKKKTAQQMAASRRKRA